MIRRYLSVRRQAPVSNVPLPGFVELSLKLSSFLTPSPPVPVPQLNLCSDTVDFFFGCHNISAGDNLGYVSV